MDHAASDLLTRAVEGAHLGVIVTDPGRENNPITYVNDAFEKITRFRRDDVIGRSCRLLHGKRTESAQVGKIEAAIEHQEDADVVITFHRADGTPFRCELLMSPVFDDCGALSAYFCVQREVHEGDDHPGHDEKSLALLRELQHRVKNHLAMVVSMIRVQASHQVTRDSFTAVGRRIEALGLLYEEMFAASTNGASRDRIRAGAYLGRIASVISGLECRGGIRVDLHCDDVDLPIDQAARLGLLLSELLTNALEHAFEGRTEGNVSVLFHCLDDGAVRLVVEDDGVGLSADSDWPRSAMSAKAQCERAGRERGTLDTTGSRGRSGVGGTIIMALTESLGASLDVNRAGPGTAVTVEFEPGA
jgi:PAS domain S-box-containing protein